MTIGEILKGYRQRHNLSQRQFAIRCELSNGYIAMLERNVNPATGRPIIPGLEQLRSIARAMGVDLDELVRMLDGNMRVNLLTDVKEMSNIESYRVPLVGEVVAGQPILAQENDGDYVPFPYKADYALQIKGDSMEPTYLDGDMVYIKRQDDIDYPGQVAVVIFDENATIKHVYRQPEGLLLVSNNPKWQPMFKAFKDYNQVRILGKVCGFTRMYKE